MKIEMRTIKNRESSKKLSWYITTGLGLLVLMTALLFPSGTYAADSKEIWTVEDLEEAFAIGGSYVLMDDVSRDDGLKAEGISLDIDFNGHNISFGKGNDQTYTHDGEQTVFSGSDVVFRDSRNSGKYERCDTTVGTVLQNGSTLSVDGVVWTGEYVLKLNDSEAVFNSGGVDSYIGIAAENGSQLTVNGGTYESGYCLTCNSDSQVVIKGGYFNGVKNEMEIRSGVIDVYGGTFLGGDDEYSNHYCNADIKGGTLNIYDGEFINNWYKKESYDYSANFGLKGGNLNIYDGRFHYDPSGELIHQMDGSTGSFSINGGYYNLDPQKWLTEDYISVESNVYDGYDFKVRSAYTDVTLDPNYTGANKTTIRTRVLETMKKPEDPARQGYSFTGWFVDAGARTAWDFSKDKVTDGLTLYAGWKKDPEPRAPKLKPGTAELLVAMPSGSSAVQLKWSSVPGAARYVIYGDRCSKKRCRKISKCKAGSTSRKISMIGGKKLKKHTAYKFYVVAIDKNGKVIAKSRISHVITTGARGKYSNASRITAARKKAELRSGKTLKMKTRVKVRGNRKQPGKSHCAAVRYFSDNPKVASVNKKGVIKAKKAGNCNIYAIAVNGKWCSMSITVSE